MKGYIYIKKIDKLGKIVLPKAIRKILELKEDDFLQFWIDGKTIKINKLEFRCNFCGNMENIKLFKDKVICKNCIKELSEKANKIISIHKS